ncbi:MAG: hypothetical protein HQ553_13005 [Chloroflexi bacterium]|nr:hypothetical protein [Chloroflexota bacterium]
MRRKTTRLIAGDRQSDRKQEIDWHNGSSTMEYWQEALNKWDTWTNSVGEAAVSTKAKYNYIPELIILSKSEDFRGKDRSYQIEMNAEENELWNICNEISDAGREFVSREIGLQPTHRLHQVLSDYWAEETLLFVLNR